MLSYKERYS